jgi:hypothetical protein
VKTLVTGDSLKHKRNLDRELLVLQEQIVSQEMMNAL